LTFEEIQFGGYIQRKFRLFDHTQNETREVLHLMCTSWPDFGVPKTPHGIIKLIRKVKAEHWDTTAATHSPVLVHCSAGVGRTGTFIAMDVILDHMVNNEGKGVNLFSLVCQLRKQRPHLVQSFDQYNFLYKSITSIYKDGDTEIEVAELQNLFNELLVVLPGSKTGLCHEFEKLDRNNPLSNSKGSQDTSTLQLTSYKAMDFEDQNFSAALVPYDSNIVELQSCSNLNQSSLGLGLGMDSYLGLNTSNMPILNSHHGTTISNSSSKSYINASWINGYFIEKSYIATQTPLANTKNSFWQMCFQHNTEIIVCLDEPDMLDPKQIYFPDLRGDIIHQRDFQICCNKNSLYDRFDNILPLDKSDTLILRELQLNSLNNPEVEPKFIYHIQIKEWDRVSNEGQDSASKIIDVLNTVERIVDSQDIITSENQASFNKPTIVHCQGGCGRTGAYLCIANSIEQVKTEGMVDVYQTVKELRLQRKKMVQLLDQYKFCYLAILSYIESMGDYANFK